MQICDKCNKKCKLIYEIDYINERGVIKYICVCIFLFIAILPILIVSILNYISMKEAISEKSINYSKEINSQVMMNINNTLSQYDNLVDQFYSSVLSIDNYFNKEDLNKTNIHKTINALGLLTNKDISTYGIVVKNGNTFNHYGSKSSIDIIQMEDKYKKGSSVFELYTTYEDFAKNKINDVINSNKKQEFYCIHTPYKNKYKNLCSLGSIDERDRKSNMDLFKESIILANKLCGYKKIVVIHSGGKYLDVGLIDIKKENKKQKQIFLNELKELNSFLKNYPSVEVAIENNSCFEWEDKIRYDFLFGKENDLSDWINEVNISSQIGICLDLCHASAVLNYNNIHNCGKFKTIDDFFYHYKKIKLIHLSKAIGYAGHPLKNEFHNSYFSEYNFYDLVFLSTVFENIIKYNLCVPITINVIEKDYSNEIYYKKTANAIKNILNKKHLNNLYKF